MGVTSTGIFCRPICPARTPRRAYCRFFPSAAAARAAGFRPCLRCRPETAPGTPAWQGTAASVTRALRLIEAGALDGKGSVATLAERLGLGERHLRRLFARHVGTTPGAVARLRRVLFAKQLIDETAWPMRTVAEAAGFGSQRRFNAALREVYGRSPSALRDASRGGRDRAGLVRETPAPARPPRAVGPAVAAAPRVLTLGLAHHPPLDWEALRGFLAARAIPGVEACDAEGDGYARVVRDTDGVALVEVRPDPAADRLVVSVRTTVTGSLLDLTARLRRLFDLDADAAAIDGVLATVPVLRASVARWPGVRVPGAVDGFETAVRAVLGQQVSVAGATTLAARLVERWGDPLPPALGGVAGLERLFPTPERLADAPVETIGLPRARGETIRTLARAVAEAPGLLEPGASLEASTAAWEALPGIGPWTAQYVAMRVLREPDALPSGDLVLQRALAKTPGGRGTSREVEKALEGCRPFRAYAAIRLWQATVDGG